MSHSRKTSVAVGGRSGQAVESNQAIGCGDRTGPFETYWFAGTMCGWLGDSAGRLRCTNRAADFEISPRVDGMLIDQLCVRGNWRAVDQKFKLGVKALRACALRRYEAIKAALIDLAHDGPFRTYQILPHTNSYFHRLHSYLYLLP